MGRFQLRILLFVLPVEHVEKRIHSRSANIEINRQVQYVAEVDGREGQACTVYDITPQQLYVSASNATELITVSDNCILPDGESNHLYGDSYLLQTVQRESTDQVEIEVDQYKHTGSQTNVDVVNDDKQSDIFTEITLSDEQYNLLKQKGWILLETNDKVLILDTLGLHDITTNQELIQQLKEDSLKMEVEIDLRSTSAVKLDNNAAESSPNEQDIVEYVVEDTAAQAVDKIPEVPLIKRIKEEEKTDEVKALVKQNNEKPAVIKDPQKETAEENKPKEEPKILREDSILRIKTHFSFKDIPDKIVLGKTVNGKNLVAKVVKSQALCVKPVNCDIIASKPETNTSSTSKEAYEVTALSDKDFNYSDFPSDNADLFEWQFGHLFKQVLQGKASHSPKQVADAQAMMTQLLQVPTFVESVVDQNILITKMSKNKLGEGKDGTMPTVVTGRVRMMKTGLWRFLPRQDLLHALVAESEVFKRSSLVPETAGSGGNVVNATSKVPKNDNVLHVHVTETKSGNSVEAISITLNKRQIPRLAYEGNKRQPKLVTYACSSCAKVFQSESELMNHQDIHCMETEDMLTIDTDELGKGNDNETFKLSPYYVMKTNKGTLYACLTCFMKFKNLSNCLRHLKTHTIPAKTGKKDKKKSETDVKCTKPVYKCKMCTSTYNHPSSLSKHILAAHIKVSSK